MKELVYALLMIISISLISCSDTDNSRYTIVKGKAYDVERNLPSANVKIYVHGWRPLESTNFGGLAGHDFTIIDSTFTDLQGNYEVEFIHKPVYTHGLSFENTLDRFGYYSDVISDSIVLEPEKVNVRNINSWKPIVLQLQLKIINNNNPDLFIQNKIWPNDDYFFGAVVIHEQEIDTIVYLPAKPNAEHRMSFYYKTGPHNEVTHVRYDFFETNLQDTLKLNYNIDSSSF